HGRRDQRLFDRGGRADLEGEEQAEGEHGDLSGNESGGGGGRSPPRRVLAARGESLSSPKRAEPARLLRCSSVKYAEYSPSSRLVAGPAAPISARSAFHPGLLALHPRHPVDLGLEGDPEAQGRALLVEGEQRLAVAAHVLH